MTDADRETATLQYPGGSAEFPILPSVDGASSLDISGFTKRTGLTTLTVALAAARVVPELSDATTTWPYTAMGVAFAVIGVFCVVLGERRRRAVSRAVRRGEFAELSDSLGLLLTTAAAVLGVAMVALILAGP